MFCWLVKVLQPSIVSELNKSQNTLLASAGFAKQLLNRSIATYNFF
ncbi:MAG: hypothetical protein JWR72_2633 [Flavisolibacter sp.]|nr:hypothetical protein [Flavisolibacter sp.]